MGLGLRLLLTPSLAVAALLPARASEACTCLLPGYDFAMPADGAEVPKNARIWASAANTPFDLRDPAGIPVSGVRTSVASPGGDEVVVFTPDAPLEVGTGYTVYFGGALSEERRFDVVDTTDTSPPSPPTIARRSRRTGGSGPCASDGVGVLDLELSGREALTVIDLDGSSQVSTSSVAGRVSVIAYGDAVAIGQGNCIFTWYDPGPVEVRIGTFDLAGNFSGWSSPVTESVPDPGCTCTGLGRATPGATIGLLLGGLLLLRRRRG